jgi:hypothetical protein
MFDIIGAIKNGLGVAAEAIGWGREKDKRLNTPDMKENKEAKIDASERDDHEKIVSDAQKTGNLDELRKKASE